MIKIQGPDWEILRVLKIISMRNMDIVNQLKIDKGVVSKSVSGLEMIGLVKRNGKLIELTDQGVWYAEFYEKVKHGTR